MPVNQVKGVSVPERNFASQGPSNSLKRLEVALKSKDMVQAKRALETVEKNLPLGGESAKDLSKAVSTLSQAIKTGDISKATEALTGVKEEAQKYYAESLKTESAKETSRAPTLSMPNEVMGGRLDVKA
jgi:hypothetical protein